MAPIIYFENTPINVASNLTIVKEQISQKFCLSYTDLYVLVDGKRVSDDYNVLTCEKPIRIYSKVLGGKGGFGSMLRAIGAQIEKTTNREACRDLSGRRLRDINEEKRLRKWLEGQSDREKEAVERKKKKIEKLIAEPKVHALLDETYMKEREELPERMEDALLAGWDKSVAECSSNLKRKTDGNSPQKSKKSRLWIDSELTDCSDLDSEDDDEEELNKKCLKRKPSPVSADSGNESDLTSIPGTSK